MRGVLLSLFGLIVFLSSTSAGGLTTQEFAPEKMPPHMAAFALATEPDYAKAKLATLRLDMPRGTCSATAIGPHKVLTAKHCLAGGITGWRMNGRTVTITQVEIDEHDGALLTTDLYFKHIATFGPTPKQGDVVFSHGNPNGTPGILLVGRVAGWVDYMGAVKVMVLDRNDWYGCSGAGVFNADGQIVGVVNAIFPWPQQGWRLTAVFPLTFRAEQYAAL